MAQQVLVQLVDDLDGTSSEDVSTVVFSLDGVSYEIDLTDANAERLRESLAEYVESARRIGGRIKRGTRPNLNGRPAASDASQVRAWALQSGYELSGRGRIPSHVVEAYKLAQAEPAPKRARPAAKRRTRARRS